MAQTINTNVASLNAQRNLTSSQSSLGTTLQRLSSGLRVNSAKDDAAGLAIAERMSTQVRGMNVAIRNANDGVSLAQTAEGALSKIGDNMQRMRELAVQSRNVTNSDEDRAALNREFLQLGAEISRVMENSDFNGKKLFAADAATGFEFQVGAGTTEYDRIKIDVKQLTGGTADTTIDLEDAATATVTDVLATITAGTDDTANGILIGGTLNGETDGTAVTVDEIDDAIQFLDKGISMINEQRSIYGAAQNRFESVISSLQVSSENISAARGRIMDADFATETANLSRTQILQQAGTAMLAQANSLPQNVLSLLR